MLKCSTRLIPASKLLYWFAVAAASPSKKAKGTSMAHMPGFALVGCVMKGKLRHGAHDSRPSARIQLLRRRQQRRAVLMEMLRCAERQAGQSLTDLNDMY